jgi:hypothetical protein
MNVVSGYINCSDLATPVAGLPVHNIFIINYLYKYFMLNFKIRRLDNIKFSYQELLDYYHTIKSNYQHMKWTPPTDMSDMAYCWSIQTKMKDPSIPCSPYHWPGDDEKDFNSDFDTPTDMLFGFGQKILDTFSKVKQTVITVHRPGTKLPWHIDSETYLEDHWKIHLPIETNHQSYFQYEGEEFVLAAGHAYLVNTSINHATDNRGTTERAHLIFKVPVTTIPDILNNQYEI